MASTPEPAQPSAEAPARRPRTPSGDARRALLEKSAAAAGAHWSATWCEALRREGRPVEGGWPGTLREARAQVSAYFVTKLAKRRLVLTREEFEQAAKIAYAAARSDWLSRLDRVDSTRDDYDDDDMESDD